MSTRGSIATPTLFASIKEKIRNYMIFHFLQKIQLPLMGPLTRGLSLAQNGIPTNLNVWALAENVNIGSLPVTSVPSSYTT